VAINGYFINGYCRNFISGYEWLFYWWLLIIIILVVIDGYWWLLYYKLLFVILCYIMTVSDYSIIIYCWKF
jgi:hypothetical protein